MKKKIEQFTNSKSYYRTVYLYLFFLLVVIVFSADFGQIRSFTNISGSMSPTIEEGAVTVVKEHDNYQVGDIISYYALIDGEEQIITHRITSIGGNTYVTKGDANDVVDRDVVRPRLVIGKVIWIVPYVGYLIGFAKSLVGTILTILLPAILIILVELDRIETIEGRKKKKT